METAPAAPPTSLSAGNVLRGPPHPPSVTLGTSWVQGRAKAHPEGDYKGVCSCLSAQAASPSPKGWQGRRKAQTLPTRQHFSTASGKHKLGWIHCCRLLSTRLAPAGSLVLRPLRLNVHGLQERASTTPLCLFRLFFFLIKIKQTLHTMDQTHLAA